MSYCAIARAVLLCVVAASFGAKTYAQPAASSVSHSTMLELACFMADGTLANATSRQLTLIDPVTEAVRYPAPSSRPIVGVLCNPKAMQVLIRFEGPKSDAVWGVARVESGKVVLADIPVETSTQRDYFFRNYSATFQGVSEGGYRNVGRSLSYSEDGELLAAFKDFSYDNRKFLVVFETQTFTEIAAISLEQLLGKNAHRRLLAVNVVNQQYVDVFATARGDANDFGGTAGVLAVRWHYRDKKVDQRSIAAGAMRGASGLKVVWDFDPNVGGFLGLHDRSYVFFGSSPSAAPEFQWLEFSSGNRPPVIYDSRILSRNLALLIGAHNRYAADGNTVIEEGCTKEEGHYRPYLVKRGEADLIPLPCGTLDPQGTLAVDVQRGHIFNTAKNRADRLIKIDDFSDVRRQYLADLQQKYGVVFRKNFVKAQDKERYVPSVSNSKVVSETLFYVAGQPVTRYVNESTVDPGFSERVDVYNIVYEVRNSHNKPLAIRFRIEGFAKSTSWAVRTLKGGFWQGLLGGRTADENVRQKREIVLPIAIEKSLILRPGEAFKSKDVWGEFPAKLDDVSMFATSIQEVESDWLDRLNDLLSGRVLATADRIGEFVADPRSSWAAPKLQEMQVKAQAQQEAQRATEDSQRLARLAQNVKVIALSVPRDYDPDFQNTVQVELQNTNAANLTVKIRVGSATAEGVVPANGKAKVAISVSGVGQAQLTATIVGVR